MHDSNVPLRDTSLKRMLEDNAKSLPRAQCLQLALALAGDGIASQRPATQNTGVSRNTIHKRLESARDRCE